MIPDTNNSNADGAIIYYVAMADEYSIKYMQDQTPSTLAKLMPNVGDEVTLYDKRDEKAYTVAKQADDKYWMTQNLRYKGDTGSTSNSMIIKSATTNVTADMTLSYGDLTSGNSYTEARILNSGNTSYGFWWSSTANNSVDHFVLRYNSSNLNTGSNSKYGGFYARCVRSS